MHLYCQSRTHKQNHITVKTLFVNLIYYLLYYKLPHKLSVTLTYYTKN